MTLATMDEVLTAEPIANYLHISRKTVYRLMATSPQAGGIPSFNVGSSKRVLREDFVAWLNSRKK